MKTRTILAALGLLMYLLFTPMSAAAKEEVSVSLENKEAVVKYDPDVAKAEDLIKAVKDARGMNSYNAKIKKK
jgi:hypothetical protein